LKKLEDGRSKKIELPIGKITDAQKKKLEKEYIITYGLSPYIEFEKL